MEAVEAGKRRSGGVGGLAEGVGGDAFEAGDTGNAVIGGAEQDAGGVLLARDRAEFALDVRVDLDRVAGRLFRLRGHRDKSGRYTGWRADRHSSE